MSETLSIHPPDRRLSAASDRLIWLAVDADTIRFRWCQRLRQIAEHYGRIQRYMVYGSDQRDERMATNWTSRDPALKFISSDHRSVPTTTELALTLDIVSQFLPYPSDSRSVLVLASNRRELHLVTEQVIRAGMPVIWLSTHNRLGLKSKYVTRSHNIERPNIDLKNAASHSPINRPARSIAPRSAAQICLAARAEIKSERSPEIIHAVNRHIIAQMRDGFDRGVFIEPPMLENRVDAAIRAQMGRIPLSTWLAANPKVETKLSSGKLWFCARVEDESRSAPSESCDQALVDALKG